jgi:hypothetical protein
VGLGELSEKGAADQARSKLVSDFVNQNGQQAFVVLSQEELRTDDDESVDIGESIEVSEFVTARELPALSQAAGGE